MQLRFLNSDMRFRKLLLSGAPMDPDLCNPPPPTPLPLIEKSVSFLFEIFFHLCQRLNAALKEGNA